ncbi:hypothetical protein ABID70_000824 [Clavibacter michiganensis]|nr:hypothetical protein [Clavibacter michiganensis]MDQ0410837.1 hypothetical protein [Clavibacter michiganensis]
MSADRAPRRMRTPAAPVYRGGMQSGRLLLSRRGEA